MENELAQSLVDGWLAYHRAVQTRNRDLVAFKVPGELFEFVIRVDEIVHDSPEKAWSLIKLIFACAGNDFERACLAAGPLEDLLARYGETMIDRVEAAALNDLGFRELLAGVWRNNIADVVWQRVQRAAEAD